MQGWSLLCYMYTFVTFDGCAGADKKHIIIIFDIFLMANAEAKFCFASQKSKLRQRACLSMFELVERAKQSYPHHHH